MASDLEMEDYANRIRAEAVALCAIAAELHTDVRELVAQARKRQVPLRGERHGSRPGERAGELGQDGQVGM